MLGKIELKYFYFMLYLFMLLPAMICSEKHANFHCVSDANLPLPEDGDLQHFIPVQKVYR